MIRKSKLRAFAEDGSVLSNITILDTGTPSAQAYSDRNLNDMVANFQLNSAGNSPMLRVPAVFVRTQPDLDRSDLPAIGWMTDVHHDGAKLIADFGDVPPKVKHLLTSQAYESALCEVYDEPPDGCRGQGRMIRRVAFLGDRLPSFDSLDDIVAVTAHAERGTRYRRVVLKFAEVSPVLRFAEEHRTEFARFGFTPGEIERVYRESGLTAREFLGK